MTDQPEPLRVALLLQLRRIYPEFSDDALILAALAELLHQSSRGDPRAPTLPEVPVVLIEVSNSDGVYGRCDAKCYLATGPECDCCCGGVNHGKGLTQAIANMTAIVAEGIPDLWIHNKGNELPPGCQAFVQLPLWMEARPARFVSEVANRLRSARRRRQGSQEAPESSTS